MFSILAERSDFSVTTRMCGAGNNVKDIQDDLGYKDTKITLGIYADVTKELQKTEFKVDARRQVTESFHSTNEEAFFPGEADHDRSLLVVAADDGTALLQTYQGFRRRVPVQVLPYLDYGGRRGDCFQEFVAAGILAAVMRDLQYVA